MGESGKINPRNLPTAHLRNAPLPPPPTAAVPLPRRGRLKSFPFGGAGSALAETEEGPNGRERLEKRTTYLPLTYKTPLFRLACGEPPSP